MSRKIETSPAEPPFWALVLKCVRWLLIQERKCIQPYPLQKGGQRTQPPPFWTHHHQITFNCGEYSYFTAVVLLYPFPVTNLRQHAFLLNWPLVIQVQCTLSLISYSKWATLPATEPSTCSPSPWSSTLNGVSSRHHLCCPGNYNRLCFPEIWRVELTLL